MTIYGYILAGFLLVQAVTSLCVASYFVKRTSGAFFVGQLISSLIILLGLGVLAFFRKRNIWSTLPLAIGFCTNFLTTLLAHAVLLIYFLIHHYGILDHLKSTYNIDLVQELADRYHFSIPTRIINLSTTEIQLDAGAVAKGFYACFVIYFAGCAAVVTGLLYLFRIRKEASKPEPQKFQVAVDDTPESSDDE